MQTNNSRSSSATSNALKAIGPGILMAGAAVGVSHLVQATRAGADYGLPMLWFLLLACLSKYPFMEVGPRYAAATGDHLISGYRKMGKVFFILFALLTLGTMFIVQAAVTLVTAGLAEQFFQLGWSALQWSAVVLLVCLALLLIGRYPWLDKSMKVIIAVLTISTLFAVVIALFNPSEQVLIDTPSSGFWNPIGIGFIIALMGWMPIPLDASVWHSIWTKERSVQTSYKATLKEARLDFDLGYFSAGFIGVLFLMMGALVMYGSGIKFSNNSVEFSGQLIGLYGDTLGAWSRPVIAVAALVTMLSTTLAVTDAYPRVVSEIIAIFRNGSVQTTGGFNWKYYRISAPLIAICSLGVLAYLSGSFTILIDFATGISFLAAPLLAWFNVKLITSHWVPKEARPGGLYLLYTRICLAFLLIFSGVYLYWTFFI